MVAAKAPGMKQISVDVVNLHENCDSDYVNTLPEKRRRLCARGTVPETTYSDSFQLQLPDRSNEDYSSIRVSSKYGMNFATGRNICVRPDKSKTVLLFSEGRIPELERIHVRRSGFKYGWKFEVVKGKVQQDRIPGTTVILSPAYTHHVTHFAESSIPIWHALAHPERYPVHAKADRIFLKQSMFKGELEWNRKILIFLAHHLKNASITDVSSFGSGLICFEKAGMIGMGLHEFGFFANEAEAHTFRRSVIGYFQAQVVMHTSLRHKSRCLVLQRKKSRRLLNREAVISSIEETGLYDCQQWGSALHGEMERLTFVQQVSVVSSSQLMVGLHGSGLVNSIFLQPGSVVIDLLPHNYLELEWHNFASKAGVNFYFMFLGDGATSKNSCKGHIFETSKVKCRSVMHQDHQLEDFKLLQVLVAQADFHIRVSPNIRDMAQNVTYSSGDSRGDKPLLLPQRLR